MELVSDVQKILLVEDDDIDAEMVLRLLRRMSARFEVRRVTSLAAACDHLDAEPVDAILLDLGLPDSQALGTLEALQERASGVPIVVLTGRSDNGLGLDAVRHGAQDYLKKEELSGILLDRGLRYAIERSRFERHQRRERDLLRQTQRLAGAWEYDIASGSVDWSEQVYRIHEVPPGTPICVEDALGFYAPESRPVIEAAVERAIEEGTPYDLELSIVTAKGNRRFVRAVGAAFQENGTVIRLAGAFQDITVRKEAERERQQMLEEVNHERTQLKAIFEQTPSFIAVLQGPGHVYEYVNEHYQQLIGHRDVIGERLRDVLPEVVEQGFVELLDQVYAAGEPFKAEGRPIRLQRRPGEELEQRYLDFVYQPLRRHDGTVQGILVQGIDVTERRAAERQQAQLAAIVESSDDAIYGKTLDGTITSWNAAAERLYGYAAEEILGQPIDVLIPADRQGELDQIWASIRQGRAISFEETVRRRKDGTHVVVALTVSPIRDRSGAIIGASAIARDITERKQAEAAIRESEALHRAVLTNISDTVFMTREDGTFTYVCPNVAHIFGYSADEVYELGSIEALLGAEVLDGELGSDGQEHQNVEIDVRDKAGHRHVLLVNVRRVDIAEGSLLYSARDVTERRKAQAALQESLTRFDNMAANVPGIIYEYVLRPDGSTEVPYVSPGVQELVGLPPEALMADASLLYSVVHSGDRASYDASVATSARAMVPWEWEGRVLVGQEDPDIKWLKGTARPQRQSDGSILWHGLLVDITARKRVEEELVEAKEEAERMNALKGAFLANMSHEIRTPLTTIIGYAELLQEEVTGGLVEEFADSIYHGGQRLQRTLNSVLDLSQLESATLELNWEMCDVSALVEKTALLFRPQAEREGLALHAEVPAQPLHVYTDEGALGRILDNLISNAIKFTSEGHVTLALETTDTYFLLSVSDTGVGIGEAFLERLFEPFTQESAGLARDYEGVGIGLTITKRLVDLMGGRLEVSSTKGEGSTFTVMLSLKRSA